MKTVYVQERFATNAITYTAQPFYYWSGNTMGNIGRQVVLQENEPKVFCGSDAEHGGRVHEERDNDDDEAVEVMQICNLNESVLRLEEMAQKRRMTFQLSKDGLNGLRALYHELLDLNSRSKTNTATKRSRMTPCRVTASRGFCGLKSEDVDRLDEQKLTQLVHEFDLEHVEELPVLQMEALSNYI